jgi:hypothetical protein
LFTPLSILLKLNDISPSIPIDKANILLTLIGLVDIVPVVDISFSTLLSKPKKLPELTGLEDTETEADNINTFLNKNKKKCKKQESDDELSDEEIKKYVKLKRKGVV